MVYKHASPNSPRQRNSLLDWAYNNKVILLHLSYILLLAVIGLSNSVWLQRILRRVGWRKD